MAIRATGYPYGGVPVLVDKMLGEAYPHVLKVAERMPSIIKIGDNVDNLLEGIDQVADDRQAVRGMLIDTQSTLEEAIQARNAALSAKASAEIAKGQAEDARDTAVGARDQVEDVRDIVVNAITDIDSKVPNTTTINGKPLSSNVSLTKSDIGLSNVDNIQQMPLVYLDTTTTLGTSDVKVPSQKATKTYVDTNAASKSVTITAGTGLTGGGDLSANRTISLSSVYMPIGASQTWQDMKGNRNVGTTYTNTTGRPIMVNISTKWENSTLYVAISLTVGGVLVARSVVRGDTAGKVAFVSAIVPAGARYVASNSFGDLYIWAELR